MSRSFSHSRSPGSARLQLGAVSQRLRSSSFKKPPEPLRRAVADCLSPSSSTNPSTVASEAATTLRDYLAASSTTDIAYCVIIEHALAERERSPGVVVKCVALLKRYLLRYVPTEQTLLQIDLFCVSSISECDFNTNRRASPWLRSTTPQSSASVAPANALSSSLPASSFAPASLVKSLNYVRSLVARNIPKWSFQPAAFAAASIASKQALPTLSSLLSKSFNNQLSPVGISSRDSPEVKEASNLSVSDSSAVERVEGKEDTDYIPNDVLSWRWPGEQHSALTSTEIDGVTRSEDVSGHGFLEVGAAALLVGDMEAKMKGQPWKHSDNRDIPHLDRLLQPSTVTCATNFASTQSHLRVITASKRAKPGPHQIWEDLPVGTFNPRSRPLFQYRPYSEQQPLWLNTTEVQEVIAAVCLETSLPKSNLMTVSSRLSNNSGKPSMDVAASVLIKLVIDMYVLDSQTAAPLTLSMLEEMLSFPRLTSKVCAFDLILNLGVHAHLLEPMLPDDPPIDEEYPQELYLNNEGQIMVQVKRNIASVKQNETASATDNFESWLLCILYEILLFLVQTVEREEPVWASALSCLLYFVCDRGKICRKRLEGLDIRVIKVLLEISREHSWEELVRCKLICMLTNMLYQVPDEPEKTGSRSSIFMAKQVDLIGGIQIVCLEYSQANSKEEKKNLFVVLFDYVLHQINEACLAAGDSEYSSEEIQPLAAVLSLADAPEAFYISVKHGVEGIGEKMRGSISAALSRYPNTERLNIITLIPCMLTVTAPNLYCFVQLSEKVTRKLDAILSSFSRSDEEFSQLIQLTKSFKFLKSIEEGTLDKSVQMKLKLSWATLHSLLHSERVAYRQNGYIWLVELLLTEVGEESDKNIWSSIRNLQQEIGFAGSHDYSTGSKVPLPIWILCGLLKSKHNFIRWGFLFVLEKLLMRCKLLLDENELQHSASGEDVGQDSGDSRLEKANTVIDIMSSALFLVVQINETDRINILKMCDMLFSQLCLRVSATDMSRGDLAQSDKVLGIEGIGKSDVEPSSTLPEKNSNAEPPGETDNMTVSGQSRPFDCKTASLAALLLQGHAIVPMQLVARVPTALLDWPLIQLAGAVADNIALGVAVGSKGRGNLPGSTSDIRAALLLLLIGKCTADAAAFQEVGGEDFFRELLGDPDSRVAYYCSAFLLKRMMTEEPEKYQRMLQSLIFKAQQCNNEKLLENPYLQIRGILQLSNDLGTIL